MNERYSIVITSCGRFDLLRETMESLYAHLDWPPEKSVLIEDSATLGAEEVAREAPLPVELLINERQCGQIASIDRAYALIETPYVFHCEDDWLFFRKGFLAESFKVLHAHPNAAMVGLRARDEINKLVRNSPVREVEGVKYFLHDPSLHPEYFSYSFNPGLRRMADYRKLAPFAPIGGEADISYAFKQAGFQNANLEVPAVRHIGDGRHVDDPEQPKRTKGGLARLRRSVDKRVTRLRRKFLKAD
jgi:hypothetical protein